MERDRGNGERIAAAAALAIAVLSAAARLWLLQARPLWHDEIFTVWASRLSPPALVAALSRDSGPPLFYVLEKPVVAAAESFRLPDALARLLPFLCLLFLWPAARRLPRGRERVFFLVLTAVSPLLLLYAAEARAYAPLALADFLLFLLVVRDPGGAKGFAAIALLAALALWTHYVAIFFVGSLLLAALWQRRWRAAAALSAGAAMFLPWLSVLVRQPAEAISWSREPLAASAFGFLAALGGGARVPAPFGPPLPPGLVWLACAAGVLLIGGIGALLRRGAPELALGFAVVLLTLAGVLAASLWRPVAFAGRSELAVLPVWLWILARGAGRSRLLVRAAGASAAIAAVCCGLILLSRPRGDPAPAPLLERLAREARPADIVYAGATFFLPARLSADRGVLRGELRSFPADLANHPGWFLPRPPPEEDYGRLDRELSGSGGRRVFFLLDAPYWSPRLEGALSAHGRIEPVEVRPEAVLVALQPSR